jgi:hypothetical protein
MSYSVWLVIGVLLLVPWFIAMVTQGEPPTRKLYPMNRRSIYFWFFILGIIALTIGVGIAASVW